jgi:hypothetical protein
MSFKKKSEKIFRDSDLFIACKHIISVTIKILTVRAIATLLEHIKELNIYICKLGSTKKKVLGKFYIFSFIPICVQGQQYI